MNHLSDGNANVNPIGQGNSEIASSSGRSTAAGCSASLINVTQTRPGLDNQHSMSTFVKKNRVCSKEKAGRITFKKIYQRFSTF